SSAARSYRAGHCPLCGNGRAREELVLRCGSVRERGSLLPVAGKTSALRQLLVQLRQAEWQLLRLLDQGVTIGPEHIRQVIASLAVDGDTERHQPLTAGLKDRLAGVFNAVAALVDIQIIGFAIGHQQQQLAPLRALAKQLGGLAYRCPHASVETGFERLDTAAGFVAVWLTETLEFLHPHLMTAQRGKAVQGKLITDRRQRFTE